jgi:hypothetical protein
MKNLFFTPVLLGVTLLAGCAAQAQNVTIEAETNPASGDLKILVDESAAGGKAVSIARDWQPLFKAAVPAGDAFNIWVRHKSGAILLKKTPGGKQADLKWVYDKPAQLTWRNVGRFTRADLGEELIIIRGGGGGEGPILDTVVFAVDESFDPNKTAAAPGTAVTKITPLPANVDTNDTGNSNINEGAALALGMIKAPKGIFVEAETNKPGGTNEIVEVEGASGGKAVTTSADYQNVFQAKLPEGDAWRVFVRHKGGPFALKTEVDGKGKDRWFYRKPTEWTWTETDVFSREDLGGKELRLGRGTSGEIFVDAVVFSPEAKRQLPASKPDPNAPAQKVAASIDWNKKAGIIPATAWGINEHEVNKPERAADPKYQDLLGALNSPFIRIHQAALTTQWTNAQTRDWDVAKIKAGFASSKGFGDAKLMITFDEWPAWMSKSTTLEPEKHAEFAALCARLVKIMRDEVKVPITYWEITNERDNNYEKAGKLPQLFQLYSDVAKAIRKEDSNARVGGLAFTWGNPKWIGPFLTTKPDIDFLSWHNYGTGDLYESNEAIFAKVDSNIGGIARGVMAELKKNPPVRPIETFVNETNVKYTWDPYERRHQNVVGTLFQASVVHKLSSVGVTGVNLWQERGSAYGSLIDDKNQTFPSYTLYTWGPKHLSGTLASATSGDTKKLEIIPVIGANGQKAVLLLNKASHALTLPPANSLLPGFKSAQQIHADSARVNLKIGDGEMSLPGYSLTLLASS